MDHTQPSPESPVDSHDPPPEERDTEEHPGETPAVPTETSEQRDQVSIQGEALRSLISNLTSEKDLTQVNRHQASTLSQLVRIKQGLATINKESLDAYNDSAADFMRATRLVGQIKQNLDDISRRLAFLNKTLESRQSQQTPASPSE